MLGQWRQRAAGVVLLFLGVSATAAADQGEKERSFAMGFTTWPYAATEEAVEDVYAKVHNHGDLIAFHFDEGVPWPEAYAGTAYATAYEAKLEDMAGHVETGDTVYVGVAPFHGGRDGLALYRGEDDNMPLPPPWP